MLTFTERAEHQIKNVINDDPNVKGIRIFITGGGCSGFEYGFELAEQENEDDTIIHLNNGVKAFVDSVSIQYLQGTTFDYKKSIMGENFVINNPNAKGTCGCGSSFYV